MNVQRSNDDITRLLIRLVKFVMDLVYRMTNITSSKKSIYLGYSIYLYVSSFKKFTLTKYVCVESSRCWTVDVRPPGRALSITIWWSGLSFRVLDPGYRIRDQVRVSGVLVFVTTDSVFYLQGRVHLSFKGERSGKTT